MASVAGVGQLLETVGVPAAQVGQAGQESKVPGQDFASAMQQAGGPSAQELARATGGQDDAENGAAAAGTAGTPNGAVGAQGGNVKSTGTKGIDAAVTLSRRSAVAGAARPLIAGARVALADAAGSKQAATATETATEISTAVEVDIPVGTDVAKGMSEPVSLSETDTSRQAAVQVPVPVRSLHGVVGALLKNTVAGTAASKASEGATSTGAKPVGPTVGLAGADSKLTAVLPQGTVEGAQLAVSATAPAVLPVVVEVASAPVLSSDAPVAVATASLPVSVPGVPVSGGKAEGAQTAGPVATPVALDPASATRVAAAAQALGQGTPGQRAFSAALNAAVPGTTAAATAAIASTTGERLPAAVTGAARQAGEVVASSASRAEAAANQVVANQVAADQVAANAAAMDPASKNQGTGSQAVVVANGSFDQTGASFQAVRPPTGIVEATASKPGAHGGRSATVAVRSAADPGLGVGSAVVAGPVVGGAKAAPVSAVPVQTAAATGAAPAARAGAAVAEPKPEVKTAEGAAPVQGAVAAVKGTAGEEVPTPTVTAKSLGDAGHAAAQPEGSPVEQVRVTSVAVTSVPVAHEAGAVTGSGATGGSVGSASAAGSTTGSAMGTHETGAAGLSHTTLSSTPTSLEVGVSNGTHGWLKIRAELNAAGEVNASLTGTSAAATEKLRGDLPALNNYLQGEKLAVGTLDVRPAPHTVPTTGEGGGVFSQTGPGQGSAGQQSANPGFGQANAGGADAGSADGRPQQQNTTAVLGLTGDEVVAGRGSDAAVYANSIELGDDAGPSPVGYGAGGGWLNVRA